MSYPIVTFDLPTTFTTCEIDEVLARVKKEKFLKLVPTGVTVESITNMPTFNSECNSDEYGPSYIELPNSATETAYTKVYCRNCGRTNYASKNAAPEVTASPCPYCKDKDAKSIASVSGFNITSLLNSMSNVINKVKNAKVLEALSAKDTDYSMAA